MLSGLRAKTRRLFKVAKGTGQWDTSKETLTCYNKEIRKSKQSSWRRYCQEINDAPDSARLAKITSKQATNRVSTIKALHSVVTHTESAIKCKEITLGAFLDTEGAFDRTSFDVLTQAAERHDTGPAICMWISSMLKSRNIITTLLGETMRVSTARGCPLLLLLWSLIMDELLWELDENDYYTVGYADDTVTPVNRKFPWTVSEVLQTALCI
jgi:hypothetical protein